MYFGYFGGSALLHLLAAHPKTVALVGIVGTVAMLSTPTGPRHYFGAAEQLRDVSQSAAAAEIPEEAVQNAADAALHTDPDDPAVRDAVRRTLRACGTGCGDLTPAVVLRDEQLREKAIFVGELDRYATERRREETRSTARR